LAFRSASADNPDHEISTPWALEPGGRAHSGAGAPEAEAMKEEELLRIARDSIALKERFFHENALLLLDVGQRMIAALQGGGKVLTFGNGGSAADAQHLAAELVGRFLQNRQALSSIALTTDASVVTAIGNDMGYDAVFRRQVEAHGRPGDVAFGITTSGRSRSAGRPT